jgi:hypothetical protein
VRARALWLQPTAEAAQSSFLSVVWSLLLGVTVFGDKSLSLNAALGSALIILPQVALSTAAPASVQQAVPHAKAP